MMITPNYYGGGVKQLFLAVKWGIGSGKFDEEASAGIEQLHEQGCLRW